MRSHVREMDNLKRVEDVIKGADKHKGTSEASEGDGKKESKSNHLAVNGVTEEELEEYRKKRIRSEDPMADLDNEELLDVDGKRIKQ